MGNTYRGYLETVLTRQLCCQPVGIYEMNGVRQQIRSQSLPLPRVRWHLRMSVRLALF